MPTAHAPARPTTAAIRSRADVLAASATVHGWLSPAEAETLYDLAATGPGDGAVVEIGSFKGKSLVCLVGGVRRRGGGRVVSIDPHGGSHDPEAAGYDPTDGEPPRMEFDTFPMLRQTLEERGMAGEVEFRLTTSDRAADTWSEPIRLLFVDGNHGYPQVARDLHRWVPWVCEGGVVVFHDYGDESWPGVSRAVDEWLASSPGFRAVRAVDTILVVERRAAAPAVAPAVDAALAGEWARAGAGDAGARARWARQEGGRWTWAGGAARARGDGNDWSVYAWTALGHEALAALGTYAVEVTVSGQAEAAGLSLGPYRDLLVRLTPGGGPHHLRLEVHPAGMWSFTVDGERPPRAWWDAGFDDPKAGPRALALKALGAEDVRFHDLRVTPLSPPPCRLSVVMTCRRFLQRLRVTLGNWCAQPLPMGGYEVLVVNPGSPDGTREHLAAVAHAHPHLAIREVAVPASQGTVKGAMLNRAIAACQGEYVWLTDADCLFSPTAAVTALEWMREGMLGYCERRYLAAAPTRALLAGRVDPAAGFGELARAHGPQPPHRETWGYCQILPRAAAARVKYCERTRHFAHTDVGFAKDCRRAGLTPMRIPGLLCLHLDHPFAWYGTGEFL